MGSTWYLSKIIFFVTLDIHLTFWLSCVTYWPRSWWRPTSRSAASRLCPAQSSSCRNGASFEKSPVKLFFILKMKSFYVFVTQIFLKFFPFSSPSFYSPFSYIPIPFPINQWCDSGSGRIRIPLGPFGSWSVFRILIRITTGIKWRKKLSLTIYFQVWN